MDYPTHDESVDILTRFDRQSPLASLQVVVTVDELKTAMQELPNIYICRELMAYISSLVEATRAYPRVTLGVSPRGSIALMRAAKGYAAIAGRDYVLPDDIKRAAHPVLEHHPTTMPQPQRQASQDRNNATFVRMSYLQTFYSKRLLFRYTFS
jgi:MoxR-like ATPase